MIDVIIPVYNSGKNIARTLNSLLDQVNYKDLCVYIVDDCSQEDYTDIINHFSKYLNITFLRLDVNSGPGVARNYGLENSENEYIVFLDSDDEFYEKDSILKLYNAIQDYDIAYGMMIQIKKEDSYIRRAAGCLHGKMYRRSVLKKNNIRFHDIRIKGGNAHEDNAFNQLYLVTTGKINLIDDVIYKYNDIAESITNSENKLKSFKCYIKSMDWLFHEIENRQVINHKYTGEIIVDVMLHCYCDYLSNEEDFSFCFDELSYLKKMYDKYANNISDEKKLIIYKSYSYPIIPDLTIYQFIDKIKD